MTSHSNHGTPMLTSPFAHSTQTLRVYPAEALVVIEGVAEGDPMGFADELLMDDVYALVAGGDDATVRLALHVVVDDHGLSIAPGSALGVAARRVHLDSCITLMDPAGSTHEAVILVEVEDGAAMSVYLMPLSSLAACTPYRLVGIDRAAAATRFAEAACVSFARGTRIAMATGAQIAIEDLQVGDAVMTRGAGAQPIRWIGQTTRRATGAFAPVVIRKGALHNAADLVVSPDHRLFIYQRSDRLGLGRAEALVRARHLIDGTDVVQRAGGFVDYFQLLFDEHQIIYAEGIGAESLMVDPRTRPALPAEVVARLPRGGTGIASSFMSYEVQEAVMAVPGALGKLRGATRSV